MEQLHVVLRFVIPQIDIRLLVTDYTKAMLYHVLYRKQACPICNQQTKGKRHKWTREEYKEVMLCYYKAQAEPLKDNITKETYRIWRQRNPNARPNMDANKIASQRRYIEKNNKLTAIEIDQIKVYIEQESHYMNANTNENNETIY